MTRKLAVLPLLVPLLTSSGCYLFKDASVDETCEDLSEGCGGAPAVDADGDGFSVDDGDCDDTDPSIYPTAEDTPGDGIDQDCDGSDSEALTDGDGDGYFAEVDDCDDTNPDIHPDRSEQCATPGIDDDCDGLIDDEDDNVEDPSTFYADRDSDGYGDRDRPTAACEPPTSHVNDNTDCDDESDSVNPGAPEICNNGVDENCDRMDDTCSWSGEVDPNSYSGRWLFSSDASSSIRFDLHDVTGSSLSDGIMGVTYSEEWTKGAAVIMDRPPRGDVALTEETASAVIVGDSSSGLIGQVVQGIVDVTADGFDDLVISDSEGTYHLVAGPVVAGPIRDAHARFVGLSAGSETTAILGADLNNDAMAELILAYPYESSQDGDSFPGRLLVREGPINRGTYDVRSRALVDLEGPEDGSLFGYAALTDDFNGDGIDEVVVSAPLAILDGAAGGAVIVIEGGVPTDWADASAFFVGNVGTAFGGGIASGDLTGDGLPDLAISALYDQPTPTSWGTVHIFDEVAMGTTTDEQSVAQISAAEGVHFLGLAIAVGETDGTEGLGIVMGAPQDHERDLGRVFGFHALSPGATTTTDADFAISGAGATTNYGYHLSLIDTDDDGVDDLFTSLGEFKGVAHYILPGS